MTDTIDALGKKVHEQAIQRRRRRKQVERRFGLPLLELAAEFRAEADGVSLFGPGGLLSGLTKAVLEAECQMTEHLGVTLRKVEPTDKQHRDHCGGQSACLEAAVPCRIGRCSLAIRAAEAIVLLGQPAGRLRPIALVKSSRQGGAPSGT